jgi:signal peptidase I
MNDATRAASISAVAALVLAAVWLFWPMALGGGTTYVTTHGISMEPGFHTGDLAVLRSSDRYSVGDVVAYHSETIDTIVMHRIVAVADDGLVTQGDNNDWLDEDRPSQGDILGTLFLRVPQGGKALDALRSPAVLPIVAMAALVLFGATRRPRGRHRTRRAPSRAVTFSMPTRARARQVAMAAAVVAVLSAAGGAALLVMPSTQTESRALQVTQQGRFSYTGTAEPGTTYPTGVVSTGETVWTTLASRLTVSYVNAVSGPELTDVTGSVRLDVSVAAADGWSAVLNSGPTATLQDGTATVSVGVDPGAAVGLLSRHYAEIGVPSGTATLTVTPVVEITGSVRGQSVSLGSPAGLPFTLDAVSLRPSTSAEQALAPSTQAAVPVDELTDRRFAVLGVEIPIAVARIAALAVLVAALGTLGAGAWIGRSGRGDVADQFLVRHADRIVPVASFTPGPTVIDVSDAESLRRVAERFDTLVLHHAGPDEDVFAVRDVDATYRFVVPGVPGRQRGLPPVPAPAPAPVAADVTTPLPVIGPVPLPAHAGLWGRFA